MFIPRNHPTGHGLKAELLGFADCIDVHYEIRGLVKDDLGQFMESEEFGREIIRGK